MLKRPLDPRFSDAVLEGRKFTTIREKPWPIGKPIMLYNWTGKAYRSKQADVAAVTPMGFWVIAITHKRDGSMLYLHGMENKKALWETEGFDSRESMDEWFRSLVPRGQSVTKHLMRFRLANRQCPAA